MILSLPPDSDTLELVKEKVEIVLHLSCPKWVKRYVVLLLNITAMNPIPIGSAVGQGGLQLTMVSEKQLMANRENGKKGGPKTDKGKAAVRYNALKHGLLSEQVVLPGEDIDDFNELKERLMADLQPQGERENMLFDIIVSTYWRLARVVALETYYIECKFGATNFEYSAEDYYKVVNDAFGGSGKIANLNRYETSLERRLYKALHELERVQMARKGEKSPAPLAIDIDVSHQG